MRGSVVTEIDHIKECINIVKNKGCYNKGEGALCWLCPFHLTGPIAFEECKRQSYTRAKEYLEKYTEEQLQEIIFNEMI